MANSVLMERRAETKLVKDWLLKNGYREVKVTHGHGTAWGWLEVEVTGDLPRTDWQLVYRQLSKCIQELTGRHGDHNGRISIELQLQSV